MHSGIQSPEFRILLHGKIWELLAPANTFSKIPEIYITKERGRRYILTEPRYILFSAQPWPLLYHVKFSIN